jgi:hypothetical protein
MKDKPKDITFHYTNEQMVKDLILLIPFKLGDSVLDAGSGKNKVWYNNLPNNLIKYECEIEDGHDFLEYTEKYDWIIGNPPFHIGWEFTEKAIQLANKGICWLVNNTEMNSLFTPRRQRIIREYGFYLEKIHIVSDKRWFGRYYFLIFTKNPNNFLSYNTKTY